MTGAMAGGVGVAERARADLLDLKPGHMLFHSLIQLFSAGLDCARRVVSYKMELWFLEVVYT